MHYFEHLLFEVVGLALGFVSLGRCALVSFEQLAKRFPSVSTTAATTTRTFDKKALQKAYPEIDLSRFVKETPRAASITIKIGNSQK